jgi:hypothetical protein
MTESRQNANEKIRLKINLERGQIIKQIFAYWEKGGLKGL